MATLEHAPHSAGLSVLGSTGPVRMRSRIVHQKYQAPIIRLSNSDFRVVGMVWLQEQGADFLPIGVGTFIDEPPGRGGWDFRRT